MILSVSLSNELIVSIFRYCKIVLKGVWKLFEDWLQQVEQWLIEDLKALSMDTFQS